MVKKKYFTKSSTRTELKAKQPNGEIKSSVATASATALTYDAEKSYLLATNQSEEISKKIAYEKLLKSDKSKFTNDEATNNESIAHDMQTLSTTTSQLSGIQGYYFWCYPQSQITNSWCLNVYGTLGAATWSSDPYTNTIPSGTNMILFQYGTAAIGYSNYIGTTTPSYGPGMLQYVSYASYGNDVYYNVGVSAVSSENNYLVGLMLGGGGPASTSNPAYWTSQAINAVAYALTLPAGAAGALTYAAAPQPVTSGYGMTFNTLAFDIEVGDSGLAQDFISLFQQASELGFNIVVIINHTCSYGFSDATTLVPALLQCQYVNYISPELYTENIATMNEYVANSQIPWTDTTGVNTNTFVNYVKSNPNYNNGLIMLPGILLYNSMPNSGCGGLFYSGGTNTGNEPNWTTYDGSGSGCNAVYPQDETTGNLTTNYPDNFTTNPDPGANSFLCQLFGVSEIAGAIQWVNGTYQG